MPTGYSSTAVPYGGTNNIISGINQNEAKMVLDENTDKLKWITFTVQEAAHDTARELNMIHEFLYYCNCSIDREYLATNMWFKLGKVKAAN